MWRLPGGDQPQRPGEEGEGEGLPRQVLQLSRLQVSEKARLLQCFGQIDFLYLPGHNICRTGSKIDEAE